MLILFKGSSIKDVSSEKEGGGFLYSRLSNKQAGWNKHAGRGKSWKANTQAGSNKWSVWGKNLKINKHAGIN